MKEAVILTVAEKVDSNVRTLEMNGNLSVDDMVEVAVCMVRSVSAITKTNVPDVLCIICNLAKGKEVKIV